MSRGLDKIIVRDMLVRGIIGVNPHERVTRQDILVNLVLYTDVSRPGDTDSIEDTVNYGTLSRQVRAHVAAAADQLVEKLTTDIARLILADYPLVQKVRVRVEKPGALQIAQSVGVEIKRSREDFGLT